MRTHFALLLALAPLVAQAEPGRVTRWLMNEPMSLMDWGMVSIEKKLADLKIAESVFTSKFFYGSAEYDWEADRIRIHVSFIGKGTEAECIENLKRAKAAFLNFTWDEKEHPRVAREVLRTLFAHRGGYSSKSEPPDLGDVLLNITTIQNVMYVPGDRGTFQPKAKCSADFKSAVVSITRE